MEGQSRDLIFALDIGTRSIIGIVGRRHEDLFHVEAFEQMNHPRRAMIDGQIEDIGQVARVAGAVKAKLEEKLNVRLERVAVAAAGRALKTRAVTHTMKLPATPVSAQMVYELENGAVNEARRLLDQNGEGAQCFCVGYSVVRYTIDGYPFTSLTDHNGSEAGVEIIATFLPTEVITSLRRCMELIGLDIDTLTLEPIAAMRAVLPSDIRLLNLAMVDIGAGTADIALTRDGTVSGYTMATVAGDEITEAIIRKCLVDFDTAERLKLSLTSEETLHYKDILGHEQSMPVGEILNVIDVSVEMLAKVVADRIEETNNGPPMAVFLVGGGSRTPSLCEKVAEKLALEPDKVAVAGTNFSGRVLDEDAGLDSPEFATPVGIALTAADEAASGGTSVNINDRQVRLFSGEPSSIMDALLVAGYSYSDLMGRNGHSITFTLNGARKVARGGQYSVAEITLNGKPASLTSPVENGDFVGIQPATCGEDAVPRIANYAGGALPLTVTLDGRAVTAGLLSFLNGLPVSPESPIGEQDDVEISVIETVGELCHSYGLSADGPALSRNALSIPPNAPLQNGDIILTGAEIIYAALPDIPPAPPEESLQEAFSTVPEPPTEPLVEPILLEKPAPVAAPTISPSTPGESPEVKTSLDFEAEHDPMHSAFSVAGTSAMDAEETSPENAEFSRPNAAVTTAAEPAVQPISPAVSDSDVDVAPPPEMDKSSPGPLPGSSLRIELNGRTVQLPRKAGGSCHYLLDMLPLVDIDPNNPKGNVIIRRNGIDASYLEELVSGDAVEIRWDEEDRRT